MEPESERPALRCAEWAMEHRVEFGGTAPPCLGFLLIEWPLPWPRDAADVPALRGLSERLQSERIRLQLVQPVNCSSDGTRVICYRRVAGQPFGGYLRAELTVRGGGRDVVACVHDLLDTNASSDSVVSPRSAGSPVDVLVCSHGARDACCGSKGTDLARRVAAAMSDARERGARIWRTTHLGGHRFAPTAVTLPDGVVWGRLDADSLRAILTRRGDANQIAHLSRGCSGLESPEAQLLDRALLAERGWRWLDTPRSATPPTDGRVVVRAEASEANSAAAWEASITTGRDLPVPTCRTPVTGTEKREREYLLGGYRALTT